jgi:hypothetical protein
VKLFLLAERMCAVSKFSVYALMSFSWTLAARQSRGWQLEFEFLADWFLGGAVAMLLGAGVMYWLRNRR